MRSEEEYQQALRLIAAGLNDSQVGRALGIPRSTVRNWRAASFDDSSNQTVQLSGRRQRAVCFRCDGGPVDGEAYAYLLGMYLGDGCISAGPRGVYRLRVVCDLKYPEITDEVATHIVIVRGVDRVGFVKNEGCVEVNSYWKHWPCVFPQHGVGRKHLRDIELVPWQQEIVAEHPKALLRGLIHSDGNRHVNEVTRELADGPKRYRYPRYMFTNASPDILRIFTSTLDSLGIGWTRTTERVVSVARRSDVAFLDTFIGPKR